MPRRTVGALPVTLVAVVALFGPSVHAQSSSAPQALPNPYRLVLNWAQLPPDMKWGQAHAFAFDANGDIYIFQRNDPGILKFSPSGKLLKSWGSGMIVQAHGLSVDPFGYIWVADAAFKDGKGGQVHKFDADGKLLMSLGKPGVRAEGPDTFVNPTGVVVARNGDILVSDGHERAKPGEGPNHRVVKFSKDGKFIKAWGKTGSGPGDLNDTHGIALDSQGRVFVADRGNARIEIFDQDGKFLAEWKQFGSPETIFITKDDTLYVGDSNSQPSSPFQRGIRVGSAKDGSIKYFIPEESLSDPNAAGGTTGPIAVGVDARGDIYVADVMAHAAVGFQKMVKKYVRQ